MQFLLQNSTSCAEELHVNNIYCEQKYALMPCTKKNHLLITNSVKTKFMHLNQQPNLIFENENKGDLLKFLLKKKTLKLNKTKLNWSNCYNQVKHHMLRCFGKRKTSQKIIEQNVNFFCAFCNHSKQHVSKPNLKKKLCFFFINNTRHSNVTFENASHFPLFPLKICQNVKAIEILR